MLKTETRLNNFAKVYLGLKESLPDYHVDLCYNGNSGSFNSVSAVKFKSESFDCLDIIDERRFNYLEIAGFLNESLAVSTFDVEMVKDFFVYDYVLQNQMDRVDKDWVGGGWAVRENGVLIKSKTHVVFWSEIADLLDKGVLDYYTFEEMSKEGFLD